ncbi:MAG: hypothetical protein IJE07_03955 [Clostridia bacterium]|nr:hypothetical protein [Clostridia bacterium]
MPDLTGVSEEDRLLLEKYSRSFTGTFAHTLDSKGRMVIPLAFRDMLGKVFTIAPSFDFRSIAVYPEVAYVRMREHHQQQALTARHPEMATKFLQWLDAFTFRSQECDGQGRVLLPVRLRQKILGDDKEVDIMGSGDHLCVAARAQCDAELEQFMAGIDGFLREMNS